MTWTLDDETDRLAAEVAALTGETVPDAVRNALIERRERASRAVAHGRLEEDLLEIARHFAWLPDIDPRSPDEIIGYDEKGMW